MSKVKIHPSSIVETNVFIGENVKIGPYCFIQSGAVIGDNSTLMSHCYIGPTTILGKNTKIYPNAVLGCEPQHRLHNIESKTVLIVGDHCTIREGVTMHCGSDRDKGITKIGNNCLFLAYSHVAHDCDLGDNVTLSNNVMLGGHVHVSDHATIGGGGAVHQFGRVGKYAFVGGLAAVVQDVIPYGSVIGVQAYLAGINVVGMKRANLRSEDIHAVRRAVKMLFDGSKPMKERIMDVAVKYSQSEMVKDIVDFVRADSKRSYCIPKFNDLLKT